MARFSITVDEELLEDAQALAQSKTKRETIEEALREFVQQHRAANKLIELAGSGLVELDPEDLRRWQQGATFGS